MLTRQRSSIAELDGRVGPYQLREPLGEGGMAVVYRAEHEATGDNVALKVVRAIDEALVASFRREVFALRCIEHPQVVHIVDDGIDDGSPWYAMELLKGRTLGDLLDDGAELDVTLSMVRSLCAPLAHIHGAGLVHRDLKPSNVLIGHDGRPIILDFGLALHFGGGDARRDVLDVAGKVLGTPPYMAPEQIRGDLVDARADLYALGCMLFECVTGRPPFVGTPVKTLQQHLRDEPRRASDLAPSTPPALDDLIARLLRKEPADRIGFAVDVEATLAQIEGGAVVGDASAAPSYLYRPTLAGRGAVMRALEPELDERGGGSCVLIAGQSGVGKTRLAMELATSAARRGVSVVIGQCLDASHKAAPLHPLRPLLDAIADRCRRLGIEETDRILGARGAVLAPHAPALARLAAWDAPAELPAGAARYRLVDAVAVAFARLCEAHPTLLVIDDLQWADELTLAFLRHLDADYLARNRAFIVGTYRSDESTSALDALSSAEHVRDIEIGLLDEAAVGVMVGDMLALADPPEALVEFLARESEGNPFFIAEYLRTAIDERVLKRRDNGVWVVGSAGRSAESLRMALPLPGGLRSVVARRLDALDTDARALVDVAAVMGREVDGDILMDVSDGSRSALEQLRARRVLEEDAKGGLRFVHDKIRECAYDAIANEDRPHIHLAVAHALESQARARDTLPFSYAALSHHFRVGGDVRRAIDYLERAGELALTSAASGEAKRFLSSAIALASDGGVTISDRRRAAWERRLGEAHYNLGELGEARRCLLSSLGRLDPGSPTLTTTLAVTAQLRTLAGMSAAATQRADVRARFHEGALAAERLSQVHYFLNEQNQAFSAALRCARLAAGLGPSPELARAYATLSVAMNFVPIPGLMERYGQEAERVASLAGNDQATGFVAFLRGLNECGSGNWRSARGYLANALEIAEHYGDVRSAQEIRTLLFDACTFNGEVDAALEHSDALFASAERTKNKQALAWAKGSHALVAMTRGEADEALILFREIEPITRETGDNTSKLVETHQAIAHMLAGDWESARRYADAARALSDVAPAAWHCCQGYIAAAEVYLALWERALVRGAPIDDCDRLAADAVRVLERGARMFPWSRSAALRLRGLLHWLRGQRWRARRAWHHAIDHACTTEMPFEEARAHLELARHIGGRHYDVHARRAQHIYERRGADRWAELARELPACWA